MKQLISTDKTEKEFFGLIGKFILDDMANNSNMMVELNGQIKYAEGRALGFKEGYAAAQRRISNAYLNLQYEMGLLKPEEKQ